MGFLVAVWGMRYGIITRTAEAPPYVIVYGGAAIVLGLVVGVVLRTTALLTMRVYA